MAADGSYGKAQETSAKLTTRAESYKAMKDCCEEPSYILTLSGRTPEHERLLVRQHFQHAAHISIDTDTGACDFARQVGADEVQNISVSDWLDNNRTRPGPGIAVLDYTAMLNKDVQDDFHKAGSHPGVQVVSGTIFRGRDVNEDRFTEKGETVLANLGPHSGWVGLILIAIHKEPSVGPDCVKSIIGRIAVILDCLGSKWKLVFIRPYQTGSPMLTAVFERTVKTTAEVERTITPITPIDKAVDSVIKTVTKKYIDKGYTIRDLAGELSVSVCRISYLLKRHSIKPCGLERTGRRGRPREAYDVDVLNQLKKWC